MKKPNPKTATKKQVEQYIKHLLSKHSAFKDAKVTTVFKVKKS